MPLFLEVRMHQGLRGGNPSGRVHRQQLLKEAHSTFGHLSNVALFQSFWSGYLVKLHAQESWIFPKHFLLLVGQRPKNFLDHVKLIYLVITWEQRLTISEFAHDATYGPEINWLAIVVIGKQKLW